MPNKLKSIIRTSRHELKYSNHKKLNELSNLLQEYRRVAQIYLDYLWSTGIRITYHKQGNTTFYHFDSKTLLNCPALLSTVKLDQELNLSSFLTARIRKCIITQVLGIIRGTIEKQRKRQYVANVRRAQRKKVPRNLRKALRANKPVKPDVSRIKAEINSVSLDYQEDNRRFDGWLKLFSYSKERRGMTFKLPLKHHRHSRQLQSQGSLTNSFLLSEQHVDLRWRSEKKKPRGTKVVGADPGERTILTLSDGQSTPKQDKHGWTLQNIERHIARKRKGSRSIRKCYKHRTNFINWSINRLNFSEIRELRYEKNKNVRKYNSCYHSNRLSHWTYAEIHSKVEMKCETEEVLYVEHGSTYMSQRCCECGLVLKSNRVREVYSCKNCGWLGNADYNSSCNHQQDLYELPYGFRKFKLNRTGFFWKSEGLFDLSGEELAVPLSKKE